MGILGLFGIFITSCYVWGSDRSYDSDKTKRSKDIAKSRGKITYDKFSKGGKVKEKTLFSNDRPVFYGFRREGSYYYKNGDFAFNIYDEQKKLMHEKSFQLSRQRGWDFYPAFDDYKGLKNHDPTKSMYKDGLSFGFSWKCKEMSTGRLFQFYSSWNYKGTVNTIYKTYCVTEEKVVVKLMPETFQEIIKVAKEAYDYGLTLRL